MRNVLVLDPQAPKTHWDVSSHGFVYLIPQILIKKLPSHWVPGEAWLPPWGRVGQEKQDPERGVSNVFFQCCGRSKMTTKPLMFPSRDVVFICSLWIGWILCLFSTIEDVRSDMVSVSRPGVQERQLWHLVSWNAHFWSPGLPYKKSCCRVRGTTWTERRGPAKPPTLYLTATSRAPGM